MEESKQKSVGSFSQSILVVNLLLFSILQAGCLSYQSSWRSGELIDPKVDPIEGRWRGTWLSDHNGHTGSLRAVATKTGELNQYRFQFGATYMKILRANYDVNFDIRSEEGSFKLTGEQTLPGFMGGLYTYEGSIRGNSFTAKYRSKLDHGTFRMQKLD